MKNPDILVFFSDQHNATITGFAGDKTVRTPNLDMLALKGTVFDSAYTSCPLCVPARMSMLTGQLPSKTGIFTNEGAMAEDQATFIHSIAAEGYETVLCGRMHFLGEDQRHGFTKRIMGDMTPLIWGRGGAKRQDLGPFKGTLNDDNCTKVIGGGNSPVLEYDRAVIKAALEYLKEDNEKPQLIVVGTYAPHFSYVAPSDLYLYYKERGGMPVLYGKNVQNYPFLKELEKDLSEEDIQRVRAAYFGMVENMDAQVGEIKGAWDEYLHRMGREGIFVYLSDHGDQIGERNLYGKQTFFEGSSRIPIIFEGKGIKQGARMKGAVSIMDIGPTLCELTGAIPPPMQDGKSLMAQLTSGQEFLGRYSVSEFVNHWGSEGPIPGRMLRKGKWKIISYYTHEEFDALYDIDNDPWEIENLAESCKDTAEELKRLLLEGWEPEKIIKEYTERLEHHRILAKWGAAVEVLEKERWKVTEEARRLPKVY